MSPKRILIPRHFQITAAQDKALKTEVALKGRYKAEIVRRALYAYYGVENENEEELEKKTEEMEKEIWRRFQKKEPSPAPDEK